MGEDRMNLLLHFGLELLNVFAVGVWRPVRLAQPVTALVKNNAKSKN